MSWLRVSSRLLANTPSDVVWCLPTILQLLVFTERFRPYSN